MICYVRVSDTDGTMCGHQHDTVGRAIHCQYRDSTVFRVTPKRYVKDDDEDRVNLERVGFQRKGKDKCHREVAH